MINLQGWRQQQLRRRFQLSIGLMIILYLLVGAVYGYYIYSNYHQRLVLQQRLKHITVADKASIKHIAAPVVTALHQLVWQQQRYTLKLFNLLSVIPPDIILIGLECQGRVCECDVAAHSLQRLTQIFPQEELRDLKQGGCPLCYRAKIDVKL